MNLTGVRKVGVGEGMNQTGKWLNIRGNILKAASENNWDTAWAPGIR